MGRRTGSIAGSGKQVSQECVHLSMEPKIDALLGLLDATVLTWKELIDEGKQLAVALEEAAPSNGAGPSLGCLGTPAPLKLLQRRLKLAMRKVVVASKTNSKVVASLSGSCCSLPSRSIASFQQLGMAPSLSWIMQRRQQLL